MSECEPPHMICAIGRSPYKMVTYELDGRSTQSRFAPAALFRLLELPAGARVSVLVTPQVMADAEKERDAPLPQLRAELEADGAMVGVVEVPEGRTEQELIETFARVAKIVRPREQVILDVTFSMRHLPFVYLSALTYLSACQEITIKGIYYGATVLDEQAPFLSLNPLYGLVRWYHAMQTAQESGDLRPASTALKRDVAPLFSGTQGSAEAQQFSRVSNALRDLSTYVPSGLPLESGMLAGQVVNSLKRLEQESKHGQPADLFLQRLREWLQPWALEAGAQGGGLRTDGKRAIALTVEELTRQLRMIRWYADRRDFPVVLLLLREWLISYFFYRWQWPGSWLDRREREEVAGQLGGICYRAEHKLATADEKQVAGIWGQVVDPRNKIAHAGMTDDVVKVDSFAAKVKVAVDTCQQLLEQVDSGKPAASPDKGRLLVTPLGFSPGVLFSATHHLHPDRVLAIVSPQTTSHLSQALAAAGVSADHCTEVVLEGPYTDYKAGERLIDQDLRRQLLAAGEVVVNLTGGTTVMQYIAEQIAKECRRLAVPVRRVALVDRRAPEEQRSNPFVAGELIWLNED